MLRTGEVGAEEHIFPADDAGHDDPVGIGQRQFHGVCQPGLLAGPHHDPVHHDLDGVLFGLFQFDLVFVDIVEFSVHPHPGESIPADPVDELHMLALFPVDYRSQNHQFRPLRQRQDPVHDLVHGLTGDLPAADRTVGDPRPGI